MEPIVVRNAGKRYGDTTAYHDINLRIRSGEMFGIVGPDGAGKTSLIRSICTVIPIDEGEITVEGFNTRTQYREIRSRIGYMPQKFSLYQDLTVLQNLQFYADLFGISRNQREKRIAELFGFSRLDPFKNHLAGNLSGGMKQKLALSCNLLHRPGVLVLDEPTFGVDPVSREELWKILAEIKKEGTTIFVSTAYMDEAEFFDRLAFMHKGSVVASGTPEEIKESFHYPLYQIRGENLRQMKKEFDGDPSVIAIQLFGDALHVAFESEPDEKLCDQLKKHGTCEISRIKPSIEDVFLHVTGFPE